MVFFKKFGTVLKLYLNRYRPDIPRVRKYIYRTFIGLEQNENHDTQCKSKETQTVLLYFLHSWLAHAITCYCRCCPIHYGGKISLLYFRKT